MVNHDDGWPRNKQLTLPPTLESHYAVINLGPGTGYGVNNFGDVVGEAYNDANGVSEAILWRMGQPPMFLGFLTNDATATRLSAATAINDDRRITGYSTYTWNPNVSGEYPNPPLYPQLYNEYEDDYHTSYWNMHAFTWLAGVMTDLNDLTFGQANNGTHPDIANKASSAAWAINNTGIIVGDSDSRITVSAGSAWIMSSRDPLDPRAVRFSVNAAPTDLNVSPGNTAGLAINGAGSIVGYRAGGSFGNGPEADHAFLVDPNGQLHLLGLGGGSAIGINGLDHVIGYFGVGAGHSLWPNNYRPDLPAAERIVDLEAIAQARDIANSYAYAINDRVEIVGSGDGNALLWRNGKVHRLNDLISPQSTVNLTSAFAISQNGMIVAQGTTSSGDKAFLLVPDELMVDANNDGKMSFTNAAIHNKDKTTKHAPYQFWVNDDRDEGHTDVPPEGLLDWTKDVIDQKRDLEDFTRLWISFKGLTDLVKSPGIQLRLEWQPNDGTLPWSPAAGNPAIKLFPAAEANGGRKYLDKNEWAETQSSTPFNTTYGLVRRDFPLVLPLTQAALGALTEQQPNLYFLFEGVARGKGRLVLKLLKNGQTVAEYPPLYLEIKDVKDMYERWTVGDVIEPNTSVVSSLDYQVWPAATAMQDLGPSQRPLPAPTTAAESDYLLLVHGWNSSPFSKEYVGNTAFKRLFWQGFKGRFGLFRWPTFHFEGAPPIHHFDASEHRAWASSLGLLSLINQFNAGPFAGKVRIIAHSMGNVVVSEALRRSQSGQIIHTYIASQAAISAHCLDATTTPMRFRLNLGPTTPDVYGYYWQNGAISQPHQWQSEGRPSYMHSDYLLGKAGRYFNYYNDKDAALDWPLWQLDQQTKPDAGYGYEYAGFPPSIGFYREPRVWL